MFFKRKKIEKELLDANTEFSFRKYAWKQFKKNKAAYWSYKTLIAFVVIAVLAPVIANQKPLYCKYKGESLFPAFSFKTQLDIKDPATGSIETLKYDLIDDWKVMEFESVWWAPFPWSPGKSDFDNLRVGPFDQQVLKKKNGDLIRMPARFKHWMGTTRNGADVLAGLIHGFRYSLSIGILSMLIAGFIGLLLGSLAGYYGDKKLQTRRGTFWLTSIGVFFAFFYGFFVRSGNLRDSFSDGGFSIILNILISISLFILIIFLFRSLGNLISKKGFLAKQVSVPVDSIISRSIEVLNSMPSFILIISISAISKPSFTTLVMIIGLTTWTGIARFTRAEFLRITSLDYIQAGKSMGLPEKRIIFRHALPNGIAPSLISIAFGIATAILTESSLSFLGVGVPPDTVTWGSIISEARESFSSWWLVIFPGIAIFTTVLMYNLIGEGLRDALDPRLKK
jgi:peptide/nickel transport system permease protein